MKLYILKAIDGVIDFEPWYDKCFSIVVRATDYGHAREIASTEAAAEASGVWLDATKTTCEILATDGDSGVIIQDIAEA